MERWPRTTFSSRWERQREVRLPRRTIRFIGNCLLPDATTANTFYAYYPYNQTGFRSNTSSLAVAVATDQSDAASRTVSDWMVAVTRNVKPDGQAVPVAFRHILSLMQIRMTAGDGVTADELLGSRGAPQRFLQYGTLRCRCRDIRRAGRRDRHPSLRHDANRGRLRHRPFCRRSPADTRSGRDGHLFYVQRQDNGLQTQFEFTFEPGKSHLFTATIGMTPQGPTLAVSAQIDDWQGGAASLRAMPPNPSCPLSATTMATPIPSSKSTA